MVCTWKICVDSKRVHEKCLLSVFFFCLFHATCGVLVPQLGIKCLITRVRQRSYCIACYHTHAHSLLSLARAILLLFIFHIALLVTSFLQV